MFGVTLSVYLPMVPFVIWFGGIINWLVVVAEGIVAAPMWSMAHLGAEGEGFGQRSMHGYLFLLNMCVRPFLMVIGFFVGGGVLVVAGTFATAAFSLAVANAQFNSLTGVFSIIGFLWVFTQMCLAVVHNSFNLILILPDQVINWVGGYASARLGYDATSVGKGFEDGKESSGSRHERASDKVQRASGRPDPIGDGMQA
jgi:conjugal transfer/type IV secretion protein DotA/TraY